MCNRLLCALLLTALLAPVLGQSASAAGPGQNGRDRVVPADTLPEPRTVILDQPEAPVDLTAYEADYDDVRLFQSGGIQHEVTFQNATDRRIVAFKLAFVMYSVFNDVIDEESAVRLEPLAPAGRDSKGWTHDPPDASTFHIGAVYVEKVRYADGEIWSADPATVEKQLEKIDRDGISALPVSADRP